MHANTVDYNRLFFLNLPEGVKYALLVLLDLANQPANPTSRSISEMAIKYLIPKAYLESICSNLQKGGLIDCSFDAQESYALKRQPEQISLLDVVRCIENEKSRELVQTPSQAAYFETYNPDRKLIHQIWQQASMAAQNTLQQYTLQDLCQKDNACRSWY